MVLQAAKVAFQAVLLLQVLSCSFATNDEDPVVHNFKNTQVSKTDGARVSAPNIPNSVEEKLTNQEERSILGFGPSPPSESDNTVVERSDDEYAIVEHPTFKRPSTSEFLSQYGGLITNLTGSNATLSKLSDSTTEPLAMDISTPPPAGDPTSTSTTKNSDDDIMALLGGDSGGGGRSATLNSAGDDDLFNLLDGSGSDTDVLGLSGGGNSLGGVHGSKNSTPSFDDFMKKFGGMFTAPGSGFSLFDDPSQPQNKTVEDTDIILGELHGGLEHGDAFSDVRNIKFGQMFLNITIRGSKRVDQIGLTVVTEEVYGRLVHGGKGGGLAYHEPQLGDTITSVEVHWGKHKGKTSIFYVRFTTSGHKTVFAGNKTPDNTTITPPEGYNFAGFHGRANDDGIFCLGGIFTKIGAEDLEVTDVMAVSTRGSPDIYSYNTTIRNWVGEIEEAKDNACYQQKVDMSSKNMCPSGFRKGKNNCAAQCPLDYPVQCFSQCIPQNSDCSQELIAKAASVAFVVLNALTFEMLGTFVAIARTTRLAITCAASVANAVKSLLFYLRYRQVEIPQNNLEKLMDRAFQMQIVLIDLPIAISTCLGYEIPPRLQFGMTIMAVVSAIVMIGVSVGEALFGSKNNILVMLREAGAMNKSTMSSEVLELEDFIHPKNGTCGHEMKILTNRVIGKVQEIRSKTPGADADDVRIEVSKSVIIEEDIPIITNHCMGAIWANHTGASSFKTRSLLRKTLSVIIQQLVKTGKTDMGKYVAQDEKLIEYANMGLFFASMLDPTGIAWMASDFVQPICGPTEFIGEIDDGRLHEALGLKTVDQAFAGSYGIWKKEGDGTVTVHFESVDKYDVEVVIYSGGEKINSVKVPAHSKITWTATVKELHDKPFYMDRWRPGLFGLQGSGGGSLLMWVPRSSQGGRLILHARLNVS